MKFLRGHALVVLALLAALGALTAAALQQRTIQALTAQLAESLQENETLTERLETAEASLENMEDSLAKQPPAVCFEQVRVDTAGRTLTMDVIVEGAEGAELPDSLGFCHPGEPYSLAWNWVNLQRQADGKMCSDTVTIPLDLETGLELRLSDDTVIFRCDSMTELLPLQLSGGGTSWHYDSREEIFSQCDWYASFLDPSGQETEAVNGAFHVYRNGELVFTGRETEKRYMLEADGEQVDGMRLACAPGDHMLLTYTCEDAFGLRYEFPIKEQVALPWDDMRNCPLSHTPTVTWPK